MRKYASFEDTKILDLKGSTERIGNAALSRLSEYSDYRTDQGYLYARIRAISSRRNRNDDIWPSIELAGSKEIMDRHLSSHTGSFTVEADRNQKYGYSTFLGKPIFIDHNNSNPERARGVVVDAKLHVEDTKTAAQLDPYYANAPDYLLPPTWVELLLEVDAKQFPKLAQAIIDGVNDSSKGIDGFSMGCDIEKSVCNICKNSARSSDEFCKHVQLKGTEFPYIDEKTGKKTSKKSGELCHGVQFFELSAVFEPADETALVREVISAVHKEGDNQLPQNDQTKVPEEVNTLREEELCPVCASEMDGVECPVCGHIQEPEGFQNPDLEQTQENTQQLREQQGVPEQGKADKGIEENEIDLPPAETPMKTPVSHSVNGESVWSVKVDSKTAARINRQELALTPSKGKVSDEPNETVIKDSLAPVLPNPQPDNLKPTIPDAEPQKTSSTVRARNILGRAKQRRAMSNKTAAEPLPAARPDNSGEVVGQGGYMDTSNESASKADSQVSVSDVGSTPTNSVSPTDGTESVDQGDEHSKNIEEIPTKTFPDTDQHAPVGNEPFPPEDEGVKKGPAPKKTNWHVVAYGPAVEGVQPSDPVGTADQRIDVTNVDYTVPLQDTETWSGTDGNGVLKQQDPMTSEPWPASEDSVHMTSHIRMADLRLAEKEIEMGVTDPARKYARIAELEQQPVQAVQTSLEMLDRVKTAGLAKEATTKKSMRMPSMAQPSQLEPKEASADDDSLLDSAVFSR